MLYFVNKCEANCKAISAVAYDDFLAKSLQNGRKRQIWGRGGGGVRGREMVFNLPLHTSK